MPFKEAKKTKAKENSGEGGKRAMAFGHIASICQG
jgi:hypothetical protein